jgi:hypothetical protein
VGAQGIVLPAMAACATLDVFLIPAFHAIEQTHAALVRNPAGDPVTV